MTLYCIAPLYLIQNAHKVHLEITAVDSAIVLTIRVIVQMAHVYLVAVLRNGQEMTAKVYSPSINKMVNIVNKIKM